MSNKNSIWVIMILLFINVVLLGFLWSDSFRKASHLPPPPHPEQNRAERDAFFAEELQLDKQQNDSIMILKELHFKQMDSIKIKIRDLAKELMGELFKNQPDSQRTRILSEKIGNLHSEEERMIYNHFSEIKRLCRPEQYDLLENLIFDLLQSARPEMPQRNDLP